MTNSLKILLFSLVTLLFSYTIINIFVVQITVLQFLGIELVNLFLTYIHKNYRKSLVIINNH
jgi:uncharacterized membrane protein